jgi:hypothetical protein
VRWVAQITDAGRFYLAHGHHPDRPASATPERRPPREDRRTQRSQGVDVGISPQQLVEDLVRAGDRLVVADPVPSLRAAYRRALHELRGSDLLPPGRHLHVRGRNSGDLVIVLGRGEHPSRRSPDRGTTATAVRVPDEPEPTPRFPVVEEMLAAGFGGSVSPACQERAARILSALCVHFVRSGHEVAAVAGEHSSLRVTLDGRSFVLSITEATQVVDRPDNPPRNGEGYAWQRVQLRRVEEPSGKLTITLPPDRYAHPGRRGRWGDAARWTLESRLPDIARELRERADAELDRQRAAESERAERRREWEQILVRARAAYFVDQRRRALEAQVRAWQGAQRIREWAEYLERVRGADPGVGEWVRYARSVAEDLDPATAGSSAAPSLPEPAPEDLAPYGPRRWDPRHPP